MAEAAYWFDRAADVLGSLKNYLDPERSSYPEVVARAKGKAVKESIQLAETYVKRGEALLRAKT